LQAADAFWMVLQIMRFPSRSEGGPGPKQSLVPTAGFGRCLPEVRQFRTFVVVIDH